MAFAGGNGYRTDINDNLKVLGRGSDFNVLAGQSLRRRFRWKMYITRGQLPWGTSSLCRHPPGIDGMLLLGLRISEWWILQFYKYWVGCRKGDRQVLSRLASHTPRGQPRRVVENESSLRKCSCRELKRAVVREEEWFLLWTMSRSQIAMVGGRVSVRYSVTNTCRISDIDRRLGL